MTVDLNRDKKIVRKLSALYPEARSELSFHNEYELLVSVILSAQCTDKKVNEVTKLLFSKYPSFRSLSKAKLGSVQRIIRQVNYYRTKAKNLLAMSTKVSSEFQGKVPRTMAEIRTLPGVGQKTANVVLGEIGAEKTFPVDTHVFRVARRLGFAKGNTVEKVEEELKAQFPKSKWRMLHHFLIFHGRRVCKARNPLCKECVLNEICPSSSVKFKN